MKWYYECVFAHTVSAIIEADTQEEAQKIVDAMPTSELETVAEDFLEDRIEPLENVCPEEVSHDEH